MIRPVLLAAVGARLTRYDVDVDAATLTERDTLGLPSGLQYAWPSPCRDRLYAACSDGRPGVPGREHCAVAIRMHDGALQTLGHPVALPARPVKISTDRVGRHVLIAYPLPSGLGVRRIEDDGAVGNEVMQEAPLTLGRTAHQIVVAPAGDRVVLTVRGDDATGRDPEHPGALHLLSCRDGRLALLQTVAPEGGYGFGPRHVAFHPSRPWLYVSLERQNQIALFAMADDRLHGPACRLTTLARPSSTVRRQLAGAIHAHPNGRYVYVANRADGKVRVDGSDVFEGGENTIAVFEIDPAHGQPRLVQSVPTRGMYPRTFHVDPGGRLMVVANMVACRERTGASVRTVAAGLSVFRIGPDGRLTFVRKYDLDVGDDLLFWVGMFGRPEAGA